MLSAQHLHTRLSAEGADPLVIAPTPDLDDIVRGTNASVDLRLGTWFNAFRPARTPLLKIEGPGEHVPEAQVAKLHYVPLGAPYVLHPRQFVLGVTLEWIRMPFDLSAYVVGKSSWGRRGLVIATATAVHPGFTGSLTLELANVGEIPVEIRPGVRICQLCFHAVSAGDGDVKREGPKDVGSFVGFRRPTVGRVRLDPIAADLRRGD